MRKEKAQSKPNPLIEAGAILPSLQDVMNADLVITEDGKVCIFHDQPLSTRLEYVEFDEEKGRLYLVLRWGVIQPFGEEIGMEFREEIAASENIYVILGQGGEARDMYDVNLIQHNKSVM